MVTDKEDLAMTSLLAQLEETDIALDAAHAEASRVAAEVAGLKAKREVLAQAVEARRSQTADLPDPAIPDLRSVRYRKTAILELLLAVRKELHIRQVIEGLRQGGRAEMGDPYPVVAATLNQLVKEGKAINTRRGYYKAT